MSVFDYSTCLFEARLKKPNFFRKNQEFYLYVSNDKIIINSEPYKKKPDLILELLPTTHVKWLWQKKGKKKQKQLKGFIIETQGYMNQFIAQKVVLEMLKIKFTQIILQSDFYDEYILGRYIDKGNYAHVYQCKKKQTLKIYAVKVLEKQRLKNMKNGKDSVFNQLKILRSLKHKNLLRLDQVFEDRNKYYFVMQILNGITLFKEIQSRKKKKNLKQHQIRNIMFQILQALAHLHEKNIMHRDLKPQNILFETNNSLDEGDGSEGLKIVDYGLATFQHEKEIIFTKCGTPGFVAPQIVNYDQKQSIYQVGVDVFSAGVILHILLVGQQSFPGKSRNTILQKNKQCKLDFTSKKYQFIATDGLDLMTKLLQKNPKKRISSKQALNHSFFIQQKPIFKFRKVFDHSNQNDIIDVDINVYKNLEEEVNSQLSVKSQAQKTSHCSKSVNSQNINPKEYITNLMLFQPFAYDIDEDDEEDQQADEVLFRSTTFQGRQNSRVSTIFNTQLKKQISDITTESNSSSNPMRKKSFQNALTFFNYDIN